jgi:hypothetical protein
MFADQTAAAFSEPEGNSPVFGPDTWVGAGTVEVTTGAPPPETRHCTSVIP